MDPLQLPVELLVEIALKSVKTYRNMLALPPVARYARSYRKIIIDNFTSVSTFPNRTEYTINGRLHREGDLPAIECTNGDKYWYLRGMLHREGDLPAIDCTNGDRQWRIRSKLHRENGPAIEWSNGDKAWYRDNKLHRDGDLPAIDHTNGVKMWYLEGEFQRKNIE